MNKTVLITGASKGIGAGLAKTFAAEGYNVILNYNKSEKEAKELENQLNTKGYSSLAIKADISDIKQVEDMVKTAQNHFGGIDILINNAGIALQKLFCDVTDEEYNNIFDVNVKGTFNCTKIVLPSMINNKYGKIINISSIWGMVGASCEVHYSASKAAIIGLTKALSKEVGPCNITVNCIAPGVIETDMNQNLDIDTIEQLKQDTPLGKIGTPSDIAHLALFLASEKANFITGQIISPNGGMVI